MVDDFLDYCHHADRGKVPLKDYRQKKWTWPLGLIQATDFQRSEAEVLSALFHPVSGADRAPMEDGAQRMGEEFRDLLAALEQEGMETAELGDLLRGWEQLLHRAVKAEVELELARNNPLSVAEPYVSRGQEDFRLRIRRELQEAAAHLDDPVSRLAYFGQHAKTFRFASRLFPAEQLQQVAGVYAFCRFTDDLVDEADDQDREKLNLLLQEWLAMAREAFHGEATGVSLLDEVMGEMRASGVPFHYAEELVRGVEMDLRNVSYRTMNDLQIYSYRVASVVGGWLTQLFRVQDPWTLERAYDLGHAMQLTNILRDVGEDLRRGRLYLPQDLMESFGVDRALLEAKAANGSPAFPGYRSLLEALMAEAEAKYDRAFEAIPALPLFFRGPVAVAASVYRGIHREIRKNGYDNLNRRARTSLLRKVVLGVSGLWKLRRTPVPELETRKLSSPRIPGFGREKGQEVAA
jgi:phytoene synthase